MTCRATGIGSWAWAASRAAIGFQANSRPSMAIQPRSCCSSERRSFDMATEGVLRRFALRGRWPLPQHHELTVMLRATVVADGLTLGLVVPGLPAVALENLEQQPDHLAVEDQQIQHGQRGRMVRCLGHRDETPVRDAACLDDVMGRNAGLDWSALLGIRSARTCYEEAKRYE